MTNGIWLVIRNYVVTAAVAAVLGFIVARVKALATEQKALKNGILCLLRQELIRVHDKYMAIGYLPLYIREAIEKVYQAYTALGGNGSMKRLYEELMSLPSKNPDKDGK